MKKILEAINVIKQMKDVKNFTLEGTADLKDNSEKVVSINFLKKKDTVNCNCSGNINIDFEGDTLNITKDRNNISLDSTVDGENLKVTVQSSKDLFSCDKFHKNSACCNYNIKKIDKLLFVLNIISKFEFEHIENGKKKFSLLLTNKDLPQELHNHICSHIQSKLNSDCCQNHPNFCPELKVKIHNKIKSKFSGLKCDSTSATIGLTIIVNDKNLIEQISFSKNISCKDEIGNDRNFALEVAGNINSYNTTQL